MSTHFVIIGNGAAGYRAAKALRRADGDAQISIITEERQPFYLRRQLGDFLAGNLSLPELIFQSRNAYRRERLDLFLMTRVEQIDPAAHEVVLAAGQRVRYDRLLVATGTRAAPFDIPGTDLEGVATFDTLSQAQEVKRLVKDVREAVILGEGIVGLTLTESLLALGVHVTQLVCGERFWPGMLDEHTGGLLEGLLEDAGVTLRPGTEARAILGAGGRAIGVETAAGETLRADLVAVGCRRRPAVDLVRGAGLDVRRGILVDEALRASRPDVFAAGDVAEPASEKVSGTLSRRVPDTFSDPDDTAFCWQRAWAQGGVAAAGMLGRTAEPALEAVRLRTALFGRDLAVIGRGHLPEGGGITAIELRDGPEIFRRLVFHRDMLIGAVVFGTGESVHELNRLVAEQALRQRVAAVLELAEPQPGPGHMPTTLARHCPICAAELIVRHGTAADTVIRCQVCSTDLVVRWDGQRLWLDISRP
ncbi:MAG: NAD(P)/FAD-dependent oxidoreductase [Planctomycetes bacterium]|nr:NAD(P)/FAD-dependent oxidoreductase [Planctomycetota bacterium]